MRKISVFTNISLDGFFEGPGHDLSGFKYNSEAFTNRSGETVDALLFGRRTYEMMKFWSTPEGAERAPGVARFMNDTYKYVASRQDYDPGWRNVEVIRGDVAGKVRSLKERSGQNIMMFGSNELMVSLLQEGLIDELQIVVNPVALAQGTPLFKGLAGKVEFKLMDTFVFKTGAVLLRYEQDEGEKFSSDTIRA